MGNLNDSLTSAPAHHVDDSTQIMYRESKDTFTYGNGVYIVGERVTSASTTVSAHP